MQSHEITNHKSQKTKLFHLYYMKLFHDQFSHQEKENNISYISIPKISIYLFKHYFFCFISTQFANFASLKIQLKITFQPSQLGKKFDSKFLLSIFASSRGFQWQKFSYLFILAACVHNWIILHSYVEKHIFGKKTFYWPTCI